MVERQYAARIESLDETTALPDGLDNQASDQLTLARRLDQTLAELEANRRALNAERRARMLAQRSLLIAQQKFERLYQSAPVAWLSLDSNARILELNPAAAELLDADPLSLIGSSLLERVIAPRGDRLHQHLASTAAGRSQRLELVLTLANGQKRIVELHSAPFQQDGQSPGCTLSAVFDVTRYRRTHEQLKRSHERMRHAAHHDPLTNLPNRMLFEDRVRHAMSRARRNGSLVALMFIDLDRFKYINDTLGHDVGDRLLMTVARRLRGSLRESDTVARLGGDEFAVVLEGISRPEEAIMVGEKLRHAVSRPYRIDGHQVFTSPSIGLSFFPDDASSVDGLRKCADLAMYRAKSVGRDRLERYDPKLSRGERSTVALIDEVESALGKGQFLLHYAPVYSTGSDCVDGFEALLRWDHPSHGLLSPDQFMSAVDDAGLNSRLTAEVLRKACVQMAALSKRTERRLRVALDVPGTQLGEDGFMSAIANALRASALPPEQLELELAEADLLQDYDLIVRRLAGLRAANIGICISEFGTGYSSLGRLHRLPATKLKLSGSFMNGLPFDQDNRKFLCAMASMTDTLGLALAVEDVDTSEQARYLKQAGCAYMQGRHIGLPDTAKSILAARQV